MRVTPWWLPVTVLLLGIVVGLAIALPVYPLIEERQTLVMPVDLERAMDLTAHQGWLVTESYGAGNSSVYFVELRRPRLHLP